MLTRLIRYEFKASSRRILIVWAIAIVLAVVNGISTALSSFSLPWFLSFVLYTVAMLALLLIVIGTIISRFYHTTVTRQAYLTHMLPVRPSDLILSKLIVSLCFILLSAITFVIIIILLYAVNYADAETLDSVTSYNPAFFQTSVPYAAVYLVLLAAEVIRLILQVYTAILIGGCLNRSKAFAGLAAYFLTAAVIALLYAFWGIDISTVITIGLTYGFSAYLLASLKYLAAEIILALIFFFTSRDLLTYKVNLTE